MTSAEIDLALDAGQTYYVRYTEVADRIEPWSTGTLAGASLITDARLDVMDESVALSEIQDMRYLEHEYGASNE